MHFGRPLKTAAGPDTKAPSIADRCARHFRMAAEMQQAFPDLPMWERGISWLQHHFLACGARERETEEDQFCGVGRGAFAYPDFVKDIKEHDGSLTRSLHRGFKLYGADARERQRVRASPERCVPKDKFYGRSTASDQ